MPIRIECSACHAMFRVKDKAAGKRGKCPLCQAAIEVPVLSVSEGSPAPPEGLDLVDEAPSAQADVPAKARAVRGPGSASAEILSTAGPVQPTQTPAQILAALKGAIEPVRPTPLYRLWIVIVAGLMLILPLVYVALIGLVILATGWHAVHHLSLFTTVRNGKAAFLLYIGPLIAGVIVVAFLFKPLFARPAMKPKTRALDPEKETLLFAFVDGICEAVGARTPSRIDVDCEVNASASLAGGTFALFRSDLALTIGLPLVAGLSLKEFAGVLAHEFGHFSQRAGMRLCFVIWAVNHWFARVVYERDEWDESLVAWSKGGNEYSMIIAGVARGAVWLSRRVLWVLMMIGHGVSGFLSRQMEYDADRYQARLVGAKVLSQTLTRAGELGLATQGAYADLSTSWNDRRLPDDLPRLILANVSQIPMEVRQAFHSASLQRKTGTFDTHPADKDRIARAQLEGDEGILRIDGPATDLFRDFDELARTVTFDHYRNLLGNEITRDQLYPVAEAIENVAVMYQGNEVFDRFFLKSYGQLQSLPLPSLYPTAPPDLREAKKELIQARAELLAAREKNVDALRTWDELDPKLVLARCAGELLRSHVKMYKKVANEYGLESGTIEAAEEAKGRLEATFQKLSASLEPFEAAAARRLALALSLLESDEVAGRVPEGEARRDEARALYPCAALLGNRVIRELPALSRASREVVVLVNNLNDGDKGQNQELRNACLRAGRALRERLQGVATALGTSVPYPFEHSQGALSVGRHALPVVPDREAIGDLVQVSNEVYGKLTTLQRRVLGRLAVIAEEVERTLGMNPVEFEEQAVSESLSAAS
jgi:Zn-dependent protease with chaperone function